MSALTIAASPRYRLWKTQQVSVTTAAVLPPIAAGDASGLSTGRVEAIFLQAHPDNTQEIIVGKSDVTATGSTGGFCLSAGGNITLPVNKISELFAVAASGTQLLQVTYLSDTI